MYLSKEEAAGSSESTARIQCPQGSAPVPDALYLSPPNALFLLLPPGLLLPNTLKERVWEGTSTNLGTYKQDTLLCLFS